MNRNRIIICGYPKSGNTWITRLTAEIVGCPIGGLWCEPFIRDISEEGKDRSSDYICFKSHHNAEELDWTFSLYGNGSEKVIYVVRDPRDIIFSAINYYKIEPQYKLLYKLMGISPGLRNKFYRKLFESDNYKINYMFDTIVNGNPINKWLKTPWHEHVLKYLERDTFYVRYEDLLEDPFLQVNRILEYLELERSSVQVKKAISAQSFENKKRFFIEKKQKQKADFMRKGTSGQWKGVLADTHINKLKKRTESLMNRIGYQF